jgi:hypothetical protein
MSAEDGGPVTCMRIMSAQAGGPSSSLNNEDGVGGETRMPSKTIGKGNDLLGFVFSFLASAHSSNRWGLIRCTTIQDGV